MSLQKAFDPQISQINADGSAHYLDEPHHLSDWPCGLIASLFSLRNLRRLRIESRFLG
ncbi:MAG: hypothetical protein NDI91_10450 [Sulfuritalea sp.]|nr:hypothetical protein [Sulfuritalea sp.]